MFDPFGGIKAVIKTLLGLVILGAIVWGVLWFFKVDPAQLIARALAQAIPGLSFTPPTLPDPPSIGSTPTPVVEAQGTAEALRGAEIPPTEFSYVKVGDLDGLKGYLQSQVMTWTSISQNVLSADLVGVGTASLSNKSIAGDTRTVTWTAVYKGLLVEGLTADFNIPIVVLDNWVEVTRTASITQTNLTLVGMQATAYVTHTGQICITSISDWPDSPVNHGDPDPSITAPTTPSGEDWAFFLDPTNHASYSLWTDEVTSGWFPPGPVSFDDLMYIKSSAEKVARLEGTVNNPLLDSLALDVAASATSGDYFKTMIQPLYTPERAVMYQISGWVVNIVLTEKRDPTDNRMARCKGPLVP